MLSSPNLLNSSLLGFIAGLEHKIRCMRCVKAEGGDWYLLFMQRPYKVKVRAQDVKGGTLMLTLEGWQARIFQHEYDHLQVGHPCDLLCLVCCLPSRADGHDNLVCVLLHLFYGFTGKQLGHDIPQYIRPVRSAVQHTRRLGDSGRLA